MDDDKTDMGSATGPHVGSGGQVRRERCEWHRRLALGLSAQLPDNADDARAVLECVEELVETFLYPRPAAVGGEVQGRVLRFAGASAGISSCRTR